MELWSIFDTQGPSRGAFKLLAVLGNPMLAASLVLVVIRSTRRIGCQAIAAGGLLAAACAVVVHFGYALPIWRGHASAIAAIDLAAASAGFALGSLAALSASVAVMLLRRGRAPG